MRARGWKDPAGSRVRTWGRALRTCEKRSQRLLATVTSGVTREDPGLFGLCKGRPPTPGHLCRSA